MNGIFQRTARRDLQPRTARTTLTWYGKGGSRKRQQSRFLLLKALRHSHQRTAPPSNIFDELTNTVVLTDTERYNNFFDNCRRCFSRQKKNIAKERAQLFFFKFLFLPMKKMKNENKYYCAYSTVQYRIRHKNV
jgi:hypothetical protein